MDLIAFWNVVKRRQRIVVIGLCLAGALALIGLIKPTATGLAWRTPPVYDAKATVEVTKPGFQGRLGDPTADLNTSTYLVQQASFYANRAEGFEIGRAAGRKSGVEQPEYDVVRLAGDDGTALPLVQITAYETTPEGAVALANGVSNALTPTSRVTRRTTESQPGPYRADVRCARGRGLSGPPYDASDHAVPPGRPADLRGRLRRRQPSRRPRSVQAEPSGEPEAPLGIVRNEPEPEDEPERRGRGRTAAGCTWPVGRTVLTDRRVRPASTGDG